MCLYADVYNMSQHPSPNLVHSERRGALVPKKRGPSTCAIFTCLVPYLAIVDDLFPSLLESSSSGFSALCSCKGAPHADVKVGLDPEWLLGWETAKAVL